MSGHSYEECRDAQLLLHGFLRCLGFYIAYPEVISPSQRVIYLGVKIDSVNLKLSLPEMKLAKLQKELDFFTGRERATKLQLQKLCGILSHCATLVKGGRTFSHRVIALLKCFRGKKRYVRLGKEFHKDLKWWKHFGAWFNGEARIIKTLQEDVVEFASDSSNSGYGVVLRQDWCAGTWTCPIELIQDEHGHIEHINVKELLPVLLAAKRWGKLWRNHKVVCQTDNTQVLWAINTGRNKNELSMEIIRDIFWLSVIFNFHLVAVHIPGTLNVLPDALSCIINDGIDLSVCTDLCCYRIIKEVGRLGR